MCIDLDHGHDANWVFDTLPTTLTHLTPSGSFHLFYECSERFGNHKLAPCIDVRGGNGWVPLPEVSAGYSTLVKRNPLRLPDAIRKRLIDASAPKEKQRGAGWAGRVRRRSAILVAEARRIIASHIQ